MRGIAIGTLVLFVLAMIVIGITIVGGFIRAKASMATTGNFSAFKAKYCSLLLKYGCDLEKFQNEVGEEEYNRFLELCRWDSGNVDIAPEDCKERCGCSEKMVEFYKRLKGFTGITCETKEVCHASEHGIYAQMVKLLNRGLEENSKVFYIDDAGNYYECFQVDENGIFVKFKDGTFEDCDGFGCHLFSSEASPSTLGEKEITYVADKLDNRVYLDMHGYAWECENCKDKDPEFFENPLILIITDIQKPAVGFIGGSYKFKFKVEACTSANPKPEVELIVHFGEREVKAGETITIYTAPELPLPKLLFNVTAIYENYYSGTDEYGNITFVISVPECLKDKLTNQIGDALLLGESECEDSKHCYYFRCKKMERKEWCEALFDVSLDEDDKGDIKIFFWANSNHMTNCEADKKIWLMYPYKNYEECKEICNKTVSSEDINELNNFMNNCEEDVFSFSFEVKS